MKAIPVLLVLCLVPLSRAQIPVTDVLNLQQSVAQYGALISQISNQATQISNQVQQIQQLSAQIRQFDTQLSRLGDMASLKNLIGFAQLKLDLSLPTKIKTWAESLSQVDGSGLFDDTREGVFRAVSATFADFDGAAVDRDSELYKPAHDVANKVDDFKEVQSDVYTRRRDLKKAIELTTEAVRNANTDAEAKKQEAILRAQYSQLESLDSEVGLSAAEIQVKVAERAAMDEAKSEADAEARSKLNQKESEKIGKAFKPYYGCMLQYVSEKRFKP